MSLLFDGSTQWMGTRAGVIPRPAVPFYMLAWVFSNSTAALQQVVNFDASGNNTHYDSRILNAGGTINAQSQAGGGSTQGTTTNALTTKRWTAVCAQFDTASSRTPGLLGSAASTGAVNLTPTCDGI